MSHLGVVTVIGVAWAAGVEVTHVLLQGPDVLWQMKNTMNKPMRRSYSGVSSILNARTCWLMSVDFRIKVLIGGFKFWSHFSSFLYSKLKQKPRDRIPLQFFFIYFFYSFCFLKWICHPQWIPRRWCHPRWHRRKTRWLRCWWRWWRPWAEKEMQKFLKH